jgi:putative ABC transport system permease protein
VGGPATFDGKIIANADVSLNSTLEVGGTATFNSLVNGFYINNGVIDPDNIILNTNIIEYFLEEPLFCGKYNTIICQNLMTNAEKADDKVCLGNSTGYSIKDALFPNSDALDQSIIIRGRKVKIIGVFAKEGESLIGNSNDNGITLPVNFASKFIDLKSDRIDPMIMVKAKAGVSNAELMDELKANMRSIRRQRPMEDDSFALNETKLLSTQVSGLFDAISIAGWIIGGFSILVGGFGIANIMFVSVKERTQEIGIQKALGAQKWFIQVQFLLESIWLCIAGGLIGIFFVWLVLYGLNAAFSSSLGVGATLSLGMEDALIGIITSVVVGIVAGFIPAASAANMDPVTAIRSK